MPSRGVTNSQLPAWRQAILPVCPAHAPVGDAATSQLVPSTGVVGGVAASPVRVAAAEDVALGKPWNLATVALIAKELDSALNPVDDHRGSAAYRKAMVRNFVAKFYQEWTECRA